MHVPAFLAMAAIAGALAAQEAVPLVPRSRGEARRRG